MDETEAGDLRNRLRDLEVRLAVSEDAAQALLDSIPSPTLGYDPGSLRVVAVNGAAVQQYGFSREELLSMTIADLRPEKDVPKLIAALGRGVPVRAGIWKHRRKDGSLLDVEVFTHEVILRGRKLRISIAIDVSDRLQIARELAEKHVRLRTLLANAPVVIFATDASGTFTVSEGRGLAAAGLKAGQVVGESALQLYGDTQFTDAAGRLEGGASVLAGVLRGAEYSGLSTVGASVYANRIHPLRDDDGNITGVIGVATDVTDGHRAQAREREREQRYRELFEHTSDGVFLLDVTEDGRFRVAAFNPAEQCLVGISAADAAGRFVDELLPADVAEGLLKNYRRCVESGEALSYTEDLAVPSGRRLFSTTLVPLKDDRGVCRRLIGVARNITETVAGEAALRESEERFRVAFRTIPDAINIARLEDGVNIAVNDGFCLLTGWTEAEATGVQSSKLNLWADLTVRDALLARLAREEQVRDVEVRFRAKNGTEFIGLVSSQIFTAAGKTCFLTVTHDITERKRAERAQAAVYRIAEAANVGGTLQELLREIHGIVAELMPAPNFYIALHDPAAGTLSFPYYVDEHDHESPSPAPLGRGLTEYVLRKSQPLLLNEAAEFRALAQRGDVELSGAPSCSWVGVPLRTNERAVGVLAAQIYAGPARYDQRDLNLLQFVSTQVARAIERRQAEEATRASERRFRALIENSSDGTLVCSPAGEIRFRSASLERIIGYGEHFPMGLMTEHVHPDDLADFSTRWQEVLSRPGVPLPFATRVRHLDGSWRVLEGICVNRVPDRRWAGSSSTSAT